MMDSSYNQMKIIETYEYILRPVTLYDAQDMFEYYSQERVVKYLPISPHKTIEDTKKFINKFFIKNYNLGKIGHWAIVSKENNKVIGNIGLNNVASDATQAEIGICINPLYWGDNIATKLTVKSLWYGFEYLRVKKLIAETYEDNKYTQKSLESLGFKYKYTDDKYLRGVFKKSFIKCHKFELLREDYFYYKGRGNYNYI